MRGVSCHPWREGFAGAASRGPSFRFGLRAPAAAEYVAAPAQDRAWSDDQSQPVVSGFRYQAEQERDQCPIGPGHLRPSALAKLALHHGELVAQQEDLGVPPCGVAVGPPGCCESTG